MTILQKLIDIANKEYDRHLTLMKFTGDWRCCFGTIDNNMKSYYMSYGETLEEAVEKCIDNRIDIYKINARIKAEDILGADLRSRIYHGTEYMDYIKPTEYNHYSKRLYRFLSQYPDYRFVQIFEDTKFMKEAIFTVDPMFLFENSSSNGGRNELVKGEYLEGYSLNTVIIPKKRFTKKKFIVDTDSCVVKNISFEFWKNYIMHGKDYFL